nr:hypothetical protein [Angustibacter aerolatus]
MHTTSGLLDEPRRRHDAGRGDDRGARLREGLRARRPQGAAGRQQHRHRPRVPGPRHARPRRPPALPGDRRVVGQGAWPAAGSRGPTSTRRRRPAATGRSPTSRRASTSLRYYRAAVFVPQPGPDSAAAKQAAASVRSPGTPG